MSSGIGSRLLAKMGWRSGEGLGQKAQGRSEPVIPQLIKGKRGLGAAKEVPRNSAEWPCRTWQQKKEQGTTKHAYQ
eukprot:scaffold175448_cov16-Tisochrysis_lutea.AAC.1